MKKKILAKIGLLLLVTTILSCNTKEQKVKVTKNLSFEKELGIEKPLSKEVQEKVLKRYGSVEAYRDVLIKQRKKMKENPCNRYK